MINSAGAAALGRTVDDVIGKDDTQLLPPATAAALQADDRTVVTSENTQTFEDVITTAAGARTYLTTKGPYRDPAGNVVGVIGIARDITERSDLRAREQAARAAAEAAERRAAFLAEGERLLASSLDFETTLSTLARLAVPELADWCSVDVLEADGSVRRITVAHADPAKAEIARQLEVYPPDPAGRHPRTRVLRTGRAELIPEITEAGLAGAAGNPEHFEVMRQLGYRSCMIVPLVARGRSLGAMTFVTAESGRRYGPADLALAQELAARAALAVDNARLYREAQEALAQAERANRAKDEFLATVSHELRTPLAAVLLWTRLMARGSLDDAKKARALELIERNAKLQAQLVEDLLDVSRIISGKLRVEVRPMDPAAAAEVALDELPALDGVRVLVVDDEPDARTALALILQQRQATVTAVGSVAEAIDVFEHEPPDVLLSDIAMPGEDGLTLIRRVRGLPRGRGGGVPAAALTAYASRDDRTRVLLAGYQTYLMKPVDPAELLAVIANLAGRTGTA